MSNDDERKEVVYMECRQEVVRQYCHQKLQYNGSAVGGKRFSKMKDIVEVSWAKPGTSVAWKKAVNGLNLEGE